MEKNSKILIDAASLRYRLTGSGQFCFHLLQEISKLHSSVTVCAHPNALQHVPSTLQKKSATWLRRHAPYLLQAALFPVYDVWHITSELNRITHIHSKTKVVLTIHGLHQFDEQKAEELVAYKNKMQQLISRADKIATVSEFTKQRLLEHFSVNEKNVHVIYNGIVFSNHIKTPAFVPTSKFLFSVGTFLERKNFHSLLPFISRLDNYTLVLAGVNDRAYGERIKNEIRALNLTNKVFLVGEVSEEEKNWYYQHCDAFLFPSKAEGFGIPMIEAFYFEKPVFASTFGSLPEIGKDFAYYFQSFEPDEMVRTFQEGMQTVSRKKLADEKKYAETFSWKTAAEKYLDLYRSF